MAETDLSKIVNLIMENPKLIEEIKNLGAKDSTSEIEAVSEPAEEQPPAPVKEDVPSSYEVNENVNRIRRKELLSALKPYVSEERSKAIDSMMSIADILDMMRTK